jgi:hypothetical protein
VLAPLYQAAGALARDLAPRPADEGAPVSTADPAEASAGAALTETEEKLARTATTRRKSAKERRARSAMDPRSLHRLVEEAVVDAFNEPEQRWAHHG